MFDLNNLVRENVKNLVPYSCARDEFQGQEGIFLDANENPYGNLNRYPDPYQKELKAELGRIKEIPVENIFLGNGSDEIIDLCYRIFCRPGSDTALVFTPTYGMYEVSAATNDIGLIKVPLDNNFQIDIGSLGSLLQKPDLKLMFICSPNNPTGNSMRISDIEYILSEFNGMVVVDEAYSDFSDKPSVKTLSGKYPNLIVMQTFSKAYGMAAARIGIAFADRPVIAYLNKMKPPYNISTINQSAVLQKLRKMDTFKKQVSQIKSERKRLTFSLEKMKIIRHVYPSDANFLLVRTDNPELIYRKLINHKIIVRNRHKVVAGCLRITVGTRKENDKLLQTLRTIEL